MYRCHVCQQLVPAGVPARKIVVESRCKRYPFRFRANPGYKLREEWQSWRDGRPQRVFVKRRSRKLEDRRDDPGGEGRAIVRELTVCPACAAASRVTRTADV